MLKLKNGWVILLCTICCLQVSSQTTSATTGGGQNTSNIGFERYSRIKVDFSKGIFDPYSIPFDVPFIVYGSIPAEIKRITAIYYKKGTTRPPYTTNIAATGKVDAGNKITIEGNIEKDDGGKMTLSGTIDANKDVKLNGTLITKNNADAGTLEWKRNYLNATGTADNFYFFVPPLDAIKTYVFEFTVYRAVNSAESLEINSLLRPLIKKQITNILKEATLKDKLVVELGNTGNANRQKLVSSSAQIITDYYTQRNIPVSVDAVTAALTANVNQYIEKYLTDPLSVKATKFQALTRDIKTFQSTSGISADATLKYLLDHPADFTLNDDDQKLMNVLYVPVPLNNLEGVTVNPAGIDLNTDNAELLLDLTFANTNLDRLDHYIAALNKIRLDKELNKKLTTGLHGAESTGKIEELINKIKEFRTTLELVSFRLKAYMDATKALDDAFTAATFDFKITFPLTVTMPGITSAEFVTRGEWYITADLGFACILLKPTAQIRPYLGVNFNIFPINRQADYSLFKSIKAKNIKYFLRGISVVTGVSVMALGTTEKYTDLFGTTSLLTGAGLRITDGLRLTLGSFWSYRKPANVLTDNKKLVSDFYASLSLDWDLRNWLKSFRKQFTGFAD